MNGVLTIAQLTWLEARRRRIVLAALLCGVAFLTVFAIAVYFISHSSRALGPPSLLQRQIELQVVSLAGLYAVNFLIVALAIMLPVDTLSGEIASGVIQTLVAKPIRRRDIVLGKWLVYWLMIGLYIVLMAGGVALSMRLVTGFAQQHMPPAIALMWLEATVLLCVTFAGGVTFSTITNGIIAFAFYVLAFIGGWIEQIGVMLGNASARYIGTAISLISPADAIWHLALHLLQPPVMSQTLVTPFSPASVPSAAMVWWSAGFAAAALGLALREFQKRAL
ncbi:MAG: ABC transporter permease [Sinobacteraceae bacterium]|nr:ABC transporter permease [Nevskiaceae bacterium]